MRNITRRDAVAGAAGIAFLQSSTVFGAQANSAIAFGIIGTGARGQYVGGHMARHGRARVAAICDIFDDRIEQAKKSVPGAAQARIYKDYRQLLDDKNVDAVLISTPVYLHPEMFEAAVAAKRHVYCEKPAGNDVAGVTRLARSRALRKGSERLCLAIQNGQPSSIRRAPRTRVGESSSPSSLRKLL